MSSIRPSVSPLSYVSSTSDITEEVSATPKGSFGKKLGIYEQIESSLGNVFADSDADFLIEVLGHLLITATKELQEYNKERPSSEDLLSSCHENRAAINSLPEEGKRLIEGKEAHLEGLQRLIKAVESQIKNLNAQKELPGFHPDIRQIAQDLEGTKVQSLVENANTARLALEVVLVTYGIPIRTQQPLLRQQTPEQAAFKKTATKQQFIPVSKVEVQSQEQALGRRNVAKKEKENLKAAMLAENKRQERRLPLADKNRSKHEAAAAALKAAERLGTAPSSAHDSVEGS